RFTFPAAACTLTARLAGPTGRLTAVGVDQFKSSTLLKTEPGTAGNPSKLIAMFATSPLRIGWFGSVYVGRLSPGSLRLVAFIAYRSPPAATPGPQTYSGMM